jgi:hypothetical protein
MTGDISDIKKTVILRKPQSGCLEEPALANAGDARP